MARQLASQRRLDREGIYRNCLLIQEYILADHKGIGTGYFCHSSHLNHKLNSFVSWCPDAFTIGVQMPLQ